MRGFRLLLKKRGERRTGSTWLGGVGEALFFGVLFLLGCAALAYLITDLVLHSAQHAFLPGMGHWLLLLVFASFVVIGAGGVIFAVLHVGVSRERRAALETRAAQIELMPQAGTAAPEYPSIPRDANLTNSPGVRLRYRLPMTHTQGWRLLAATAFGGVWNCMTVVLVTLAIDSHVTRNPNWFLTVLVLPFLAIAAWSIYYFWQQVWTLTGIGPTILEVSEHPLFPGGQFQVFLSQAGHLELEFLQVDLACDEEATYHQGTDMRSERCRVYQTRLFRKEQFTIEPGISFEEHMRLHVPSQAMHSFLSEHNTVQWQLVVTGVAHAWPPFERVFPLVVVPGGPPGGER